MGDKQSEYVSQKLLDSFYEKVANDVANNIQDTGVWAKAFAKADGDEQKAKALYIELMVENMILEEEARQELEAEKRLEKIKEINEREQLEREKENREKNEQAYKKMREISDEAEEWLLSWRGLVYFLIAIPIVFYVWIEFFSDY